MKVQKYGICLSRLTEADIELVRRMRNREDIRRNMFVQDHISMEDQALWFSKVNNIYNYFFLILCDDHPVGLIHMKDVDYSARTCESGIFLWDSRASLSGVSVKAGVCLTDLAISALGMEKTFARVKPDNVLANRHNLSLGFLSSGGAENSCLVLEKSRFMEFAPKLRRICSLGRDTEPASIEDVEFPDDSVRLELYDGLPEPARSAFARKIKKYI